MLMKRSLVLSTIITTGAFACVLVTAGGFQPAIGGNAATDPGVRGGPAGAGGTYPVLDYTNSASNAADMALFSSAAKRFREVDSVSGTLEAGTGLGPTFNANSCAMCHAYPAVGGSSPFMNPQLANNFPHLDGASNPADLSRFLTLNGPVREVRFINNPDGTTDGGVHGIFTIAGRTDARGCTLQQPNFDEEIAAHNASFRIPTPVYGLGLVENTPDAELELNMDSTAESRQSLGIGGSFNTTGNDGTLTRFGWKAQNKSLLMFAGEAYNVEQGVSNELFPNERFPAGTPLGVIENSTFNATPEDAPVLSITSPTGSPASDYSSDIVNFAAFMRMSAPPAATTHTVAEVRGAAVFSQIGCTLCHSPTLVTAKSIYPTLSNVQYHPYSDFAVHHMGTRLADGITQGSAGPDEFRTAPLWGIGQRVYFLHDGRTNDLMQAIVAHSSPGSEANQVIRMFNGLPEPDQQNLLNFLRSL